MWQPNSLELRRRGILQALPDYFAFTVLRNQIALHPRSTSSETLGGKVGNSRSS